MSKVAQILCLGEFWSGARILGNRRFLAIPGDPGNPGNPGFPESQEIPEFPEIPEIGVSGVPYSYQRLINSNFVRIRQKR